MVNNRFISRKFIYVPCLYGLLLSFISHNHLFIRLDSFIGCRSLLYLTIFALLIKGLLNLPKTLNYFGISSPKEAIVVVIALFISMLIDLQKNRDGMLDINVLLLSLLEILIFRKVLRNVFVSDLPSTCFCGVTVKGIIANICFMNTRWWLPFLV